MMVVNPWDTLLVENTEYFHGRTMEDKKNFKEMQSDENEVNKVCTKINSDFALERAENPTLS
jgi:hypothetical protein